jgi:hypothetical protein
MGGFVDEILEQTENSVMISIDPFSASFKKAALARLGPQASAYAVASFEHGNFMAESLK